MKKSAKTKMMVKSNQEKDWTEPPYMSKQDHEDLKTVKRLYEKGKFKEALQFASDLDTAVRDEIPLAIWKEIGGELTPSGEEELRRQQKGEPQETDYSDEFSTLKELHEDNIGRKFTDEEFNEIFSVAEKMQPNLSKHTDSFQNDMMGLLMLFDEATHKWEEGKLVKDVKGNPKEDIKKMIADLEKVIDYYVNDKNANWGTVGTLANIHEALGKQLYSNYEKHLGYSHSIEEGLKRHSEAAKNLLIQAETEVEILDPKKHLPDLARWKKFFDELMEGFQGALQKIKSDEKLTPEIRKKLEEIFAVSQSHAISAWVSELLDGRREITEEDLKKIEERYKVVERLKRELKFDEEEETPSEKKNVVPVKKQSLREEAITIAVKLGDKELAKYLEKAPMKSIQRRIKALREEAEKMGRKTAKKSK